jgi:myosin heavy subunit
MTDNNHHVVVDNMILLKDPSEESILHNLEARYAKDHIYVRC